MKELVVFILILFIGILPGTVCFAMENEPDGVEGIKFGLYKTYFTGIKFQAAKHRLRRYRWEGKNLFFVDGRLAGVVRSYTFKERAQEYWQKYREKFIKYYGKPDKDGDKYIRWTGKNVEVVLQHKQNGNDVISQFIVTREASNILKSTKYKSVEKIEALPPYDFLRLGFTDHVLGKLAVKNKESPFRFDGAKVLGVRMIRPAGPFANLEEGDIIVTFYDAKGYMKEAEWFGTWMQKTLKKGDTVGVLKAREAYQYLRYAKIIPKSELEKQ